MCVSTKNKEEIIDTWGSEVNDLNQLKRKMKVFPNAYYPEEFFKMDKKAVREELGRKEAAIPIIRKNIWSAVC